MEHVRKRAVMRTDIWYETLKGNHLGDLGIGEGIILKRNLNKYIAWL
jgi:hypothetical protein